MICCPTMRYKSQREMKTSPIELCKVLVEGHQCLQKNSDNRSMMIIAKQRSKDIFVKFVFFKKFSLLTKHIFYPFPISFNEKRFPKHLKGGSSFDFSIMNMRSQQSKFTLSFSSGQVRRIQQYNIRNKFYFVEF